MTDAERIAAGLSEAQKRVLAVLGHFESECGFTSFKHTAERCGMSVDEVAPILRQFRKDGLAVFETGLVTDDGEFYGSGYSGSDLGMEVQDLIEEAQSRKVLERSNDTD